MLFFLCNLTALHATLSQDAYDSLTTQIHNLIDTKDFGAAEKHAASLLKILAREDSLTLYLNVVKSVGAKFRKADEARTAETLLRQALPEALWRTPRNDTEASKLAWTLVQLGYNYNVALGEYTQAKEAYKLALKHLPSEEHQTYNTAKYIRKPLGNIYTRLGEFAASEIELKHFIQITREQRKLLEAAKGYNDLGLLYRNWHKLDLAESSYRDGISLLTDQWSTKAMLLLNLSDLQIELGLYEEATANLDASYDFLVREGKRDNPDYLLELLFSNVLKKRGIIYKETGAYERALTATEREFQHLTNYYSSTNRREFGKHYVQKGLLYLAMDDPAKALAQFQQALQSVLYDYTPAGPHDLPSPADCYAENTIMEALDGMAQTYQSWYETEAKAFYLQQALACYELMHAVEQALRQSYLYNSSKLFNLEESRQQSENAIRVAHQLYTQNGETDLLYQAFVFAERNRSSLLREAFRANQAATQAGLSAEELAAESALQRAVSQAEEDLFRLRSEENSPDTLVQNAEQALLAAQDAMRSWLQALEARHPRYYQLKYADDVPTLAELQSMLAQDEVLLEYFVGEEKIYVFKIDRQGLSLRELPKPKRLTERILAWRGAIENYQMPGYDRAQLTRDYQTEGHRLYQELIAPLAAEIKGKSLLLVTSGMLDLLPFEALLTRAVEAGTSFVDHPYLLRNHAVSYTYAAGLQWSLHQLERHQGDKGGFAPSFDGRAGWPSLGCSADLLTTTVDDPNNLFLAEAATINQLQAQAARFRLLHLATHAQANAQQGDFSFIVFSDGRGGYDSLFAKDLYLYDLETELVILSACETALGTLYNSEGVISLARAFHYAGARSVVNTLWRINENANCNLLEGFYTALDDGRDKRTALRHAKLTYLENADPRSAHPVYWAGFQLLGNVRPLDPGLPWYVWIGLGGLLLAVGGLSFLLWQKRRE